MGLLLALSLLPTARPAEAQTLELVLDLTGEWKFEVGDEPAWSAQQFDDSRWEQIHVPGQWEEQGYPGYDGFAWYRKKFKAPARPVDGALYLRIGNVDDVDETYINGLMVGYYGELPPHYATGYGQLRQYAISPDIIRWGEENVIAVRVYDGEMAGGIVNAPVGIYGDRDMLKVEYPLIAAGPAGKEEKLGNPGGVVWRFRTGDKREWANPDFDDRDWKPTVVPLEWDALGHKDYDGFGWYRVRFKTPNIDPTRNIILLLGRIDDVDEAFVNGSLIGRTGKMPPNWRRDDSYGQIRAYTIPAGRLTPGAENVLAVRVYDGWRHGGIYDGPIGFVTRDRYVAWSRENRPKTTVLHRIIEFFSGDDSPYEPDPPEPPAQRHTP